MTTAARVTYRLRDVAALTGASLSTVKGWTKSGRLPSSQPSGPGGVVLIRPSDLDRFIEQHLEGHQPVALVAVPAAGRRRRTPA